MNTVEFMFETQKEMEDAGVEIILEHNNTHVPLSDGMLCNGYFDDDPKLVFACATGKPFEEWFPIYVHEYGHFTQWRDKIPEWEGVIIDGLYYDDFLDLWLDQGKQFSRYVIDRFLNASIAIEADCERRALAIIKKNDFPIDADEYAQMANSYVHFYNYIKLNRKWYIPGREPYKIKEVYSQFSTTIDDEFPISYEYMDLFEQHCF